MPVKDTIEAIKALPTREWVAYDDKIDTDDLRILAKSHERMEQALRHYAGHRNWELSDGHVGDYDLYRPDYDGEDLDVMITHGFEIAQQALKDIEPAKETDGK